VEKLDYLVWKRDDGGADQYEALVDAARSLLFDADLVGLSVCLADTDDDIPKPSLLMGRGPDLAGVVSIWLHSLDDRGPAEEALAATGAAVDGYLVTESVPQRRLDRDWPDNVQSPGVTHFTWFPKPDRLTDEEFFHGWHVRHTPASAVLHPLRWEYVRDAVARPVTPGAPPVRAVVFERFRTVEDYVDPDRLYGSPEALAETMEHLPSYADLESISSRPLHEVILKSW
jgi:hypothetical protein